MRELSIGWELVLTEKQGVPMYISQSSIRNLIPFAVVFDSAVAVKVLAGYSDPTLVVCAVVSLVVVAVPMMDYYFRNY